MEVFVVFENTQDDAQDRDWRQALLNTIMNLHVL
jgi:hypothetical protein